MSTLSLDKIKSRYRHEATAEAAWARLSANTEAFRTQGMLCSILPNLHILIPHVDKMRAEIDLKVLGVTNPRFLVGPVVTPWVRKRDPMKKKIKEYSS